ncbi:MAG: hypothetical protein M1835_005939 [Candelina submexicana]|nr:MAG: hypothetical protein M1835_005939 [Candelina submexicana]
MTALMDSQSDSLNISQIKGFILGFHSERKRPASDALDHQSSLGSEHFRSGDHVGAHKPALRHNPTAPLHAQVLANHAGSLHAQVPDSGRHESLESNYSRLPSTVAESPAHHMYYSTSQTSAAGLSQGDTQVEPSYIYEQYLKKDRASTATAGLDESNGRTTLASGTTPETYGTSHTGHIDLLQNLETEERAGADKEEHLERRWTQEEEADEDDEDDFDELSQARVEFYPEARRFKQPKTPATHGKKRNHNGEIVTPVLPTNPFHNLVAGPGGVMALSQVFGATQAASSPLLQEIPSDQISERPSPNVFNARKSPESAMSSSPVKFPETAMKRIPGEPMATYISMAKSQEERERLQKMQATSSPIGAEGSPSDDGFSSDGSSRARRMRQKAKREFAIQQSFAGVSAPPRAGRVIKAQQKKGDQQQLTKNGASVKNALLLSDDLETNMDGHPASPSEKEAELESFISGPRRPRQRESISVTDSRAQQITGLQVPRTSTRPTTGNVDLNGSQSSPSSYRSKGVPATTAKPAEGILIEPASGQVSHSSSGSTEKIDIVIGGTQTIVVTDSQPSLLELGNSDVQPPDNAAVPAHSTSVDSRLFASQSQFNSLAMSARAASTVDPALTVVENSSIPQPPRSPSQMCSSSPLVTRNQSRGKNTTKLEVEAAPPPTGGASSPIMQLNKAFRGTVSPKLGQHGPSAVNYSIGAERDNVENDPAENWESKSPAAHQNSPALSPNPPQTKAQLGRSPTTVISRTQPKTRTLRRKVIPETSPADRFESTSPTNGLTSGEPQHLRIHEEAYDSNLKSANRRSWNSPRTNVLESVQTTLRPSLSTDPAEHRLQSPTPARPLISSTYAPSRTLTEIAADPSTPDPLGDIDMDVDLYTIEDVAFQATINGSSPVRPTKKRRRGVADTTVRDLKKQVKEIPPEASLIPDHCVQRSLGAALGSSDAASRPEPLLRKYGKRQSVQKNKKGGEFSDMAERDPEPTPHRVPEAAKANANCSGRLEATKASKTTQNKPHLQRRRDETSERTNPHGITGKEQISSCMSPALSPDTDVPVPGRVLARFRGQNIAYYPATCIKEEGAPALHHFVRFDDGTIDRLETQHLRRLELRLGDTVKVDLEAFRTKNFTVSGFKDRVNLVADTNTPSRGFRETSTRAQEYPLTDVYGHTAVLLTPKQRESGVGDVLTNNHESIEIPITSIYITARMWTHFSDRTHHRLSTGSGSLSKSLTPALQPSVPTTPSSRTRRLTALALAPPRASAVPIPTSMKGSGLFNCMAFAVTYLGEDVKKDRVIRQITQQGGRILLDGFEELFNLDSLQPITPSKAYREGKHQPLSLTYEAETLGFVCLIADKHSRRAKYIQALALGLPCLSGRWIADCVAKGRILDWEPYLLPSGESSFLDGATRSRVLQSYPAESACFSSTIERRSRLLKGRSVLLIMGKGKAEEPRRTYIFLTYVLGASRVSRVASVDAARKALADNVDGWDWVYVDRNEASVEKALLPKLEAGKKRKRGTNDDDVNGDGTAMKKVKVVGNEFVIQSLILGRLLEED